MVHADYVRVLKPLLPKQAFFANPKKLRVAGIHILIIGVSWGLFRVVFASVLACISASCRPQSGLSRVLRA